MKSCLSLFFVATSFIFISTVNSQTTTGSLTIGGVTRTYRVHLPPGFSASTSVPLVLNLHGRSSTGQQQELYTGFNTVADTAHVVVAYPDAVTNQGAVQWNVFGLSATPDDVGFISALIDTLHKHYNIDLSRVYSIGLSSGGYMSYKLACALNCRIAAIASVAGLLVEHPLAVCTFTRPVSVFQIHGTADPTVAYSGAHGTVASVRTKDGCPGTVTVTNLPNINTSDGSTVIDSTWTPCNSGTEVKFYTIVGGEHTWPDALVSIGVTNHDFNGNSTIWNFVKRFSIPAANLSISGLATSYCSSASPVTMTGTPSGGTFSGTGVSGSTFTPSAVTPGNTVVVTYTRSSGGCTYSTTKSVTVSAGATATISPTTVTICGGSTTLTASGGVSFSWSTGATTASITVSPVSTTPYTVTVTDGTGCTGTASRTVTVTTGLTATISPATATICNGQSATLTASGGTNYSWSNAATSTTITVNPTTNTTYTVTVTDAGGSCSATASRTVTVNANPSAAISPATASVCNGASTTLTASGGGTYSWSNASTSASITVNPSSTTTYVVTVTNVNSCTASASRNVDVNNPTVSISPATVTICSGSATLTASGFFLSYAWSTGETTVAITVSPSSTTSYSVTVMDANGCTATSSRTVTVSTSLTATITPATAIICNGESVTLIASGGTNYSWSNAATSATITVNPTSNTTYNVTVTDAGGSCSATASRNVTVNSLPNATASANPNSIQQGSPATLIASGGTTYSWSSGQTSASFTDIPLVPTTYTVTVTDANGCSASAQVAVDVSPMGINAPASLLSFEIYPNPVNSGMLNIEYQTAKPASCEIEIYSLAGKKIFGLKTFSDSQTSSFQISTKETRLTAGVYYVRIKGEDILLTRKVVVME